jgi:hypothetical protein
MDDGERIRLVVLAICKHMHYREHIMGTTPGSVFPDPNYPKVLERIKQRDRDLYDWLHHEAAEILGALDAGKV